MMRAHSQPNWYLSDSPNLKKKGRARGSDKQYSDFDLSMYTEEVRKKHHQARGVNLPPPWSEN